jgi:hypothetical protein
LSTAPPTPTDCEGNFKFIVYRLSETVYDEKNRSSQSPYLFITKNETASGSYDDGLFIYFGDKQPKHITFEMYTEDPNIETCDLRLTSVDSTTVANATSQNVTSIVGGKVTTQVVYQ